MKFLAKFVDTLSRLTALICGVCLTAMVLIVSWQVFKRFFFHQTPYWSEETAQLLTLYFGLFGAAFVYRENLHIGIEFFKKRLSRKLKPIHHLFLQLAIGSFGLYMVVWGLRLVVGTWNQTMPATQIPTGLSYLPLPLSGGLIFAFALEKLLITKPVEEAEEQLVDG